MNGIGERAWNADLLSCILAFRYGFGISESAAIGDPVDLSWARRFGLWAAYAFGQPLPPAWPGVGRNAFAHESGIHADGALKDRGNYELYDDDALGPFPADWFTRQGRVVLTGEYGGKAGFRHVLDGLGIEVADGEEDLVFSLVQLCASATGKPLTDDELRLIAGYPRQLALLFPGQLPRHRVVRDPSPRTASACSPGAGTLPFRARDKAARRLGDRGRTGLVATIGPVAAGVMLAFAWNMAVSQPQHAAEDEPGVTTQVGQTVQQAAEQAWARASHIPEGGADGRQGTRQARSG